MADSSDNIITFPSAGFAIDASQPKSRIALVDRDGGGFIALLQVEGEQRSVMWSGVDYRGGVSTVRAKAKALGIYFIDYTDPPQDDRGGEAA